MPVRIVMIGAGNVATHLAQAFDTNSDMCVVQVYSRTFTAAKTLAQTLKHAESTDNADSIRKDADIYIVSISDDAIQNLATTLADFGHGLWVHTSGSIPMEALKPISSRYGVLYPLQTFSKTVPINIAEIPVFIEGCDNLAEKDIYKFSSKIFRHTYRADSNKRKKMHIAAVFACNFANYLWDIADKTLAGEGLPFSVLEPLLKETMRKAFTTSPFKGQTGPAVRGDHRVMDAHLELLSSEYAEIYRLLSNAIQTSHAKKG